MDQHSEEGGLASAQRDQRRLLHVPRIHHGVSNQNNATLAKIVSEAEPGERGYKFCSADAVIVHELAVDDSSIIFIAVDSRCVPRVLERDGAKPTVEPEWELNYHLLKGNSS
nr:hypothetical protein L203_02129 [Cryptococcus depauperatus CBS 7841]